MSSSKLYVGNFTYDTTESTIEALFAGTTYEGERTAAADAMQRIRDRLRSLEKSDKPIEFRFAMPDMWSRKLFIALLRRYGIKPYRYSGQRHTTVMARVPSRFVDETLWPEFERLVETLRIYIHEVTNRVISEAIFADTSEAQEEKSPQERGQLLPEF
jgi:hypothetical protein